ncbi:hypothetical protein LOK49_LG02G01748 [Camellia lanceoleosa]|uniref:Uncharacterized protein n=1 Tax=Camellia lanceoleosa TaxID=1840588 RepID=A0ACC0IL10_9ERIC|nr:hypothetical protein LOK49_LG02G01748 [Camellia lanceoleosa]
MAKPDFQNNTVRVSSSQISLPKRRDQGAGPSLGRKNLGNNQIVGPQFHSKLCDQKGQRKVLGLGLFNGFGLTKQNIEHVGFGKASSNGFGPNVGKEGHFQLKSPSGKSVVCSYGHTTPVAQIFDTLHQGSGLSQTGRVLTTSTVSTVSAGDPSTTNPRLADGGDDFNFVRCRTVGEVNRLEVGAFRLKS